MKKLSFREYLVVGSMLFGLFFGAGNLIFPIFLGQEASSQLLPSLIGFIITGVGLPLLTVNAMGVTGEENMLTLTSHIHPQFGKFLTLLLYLTIGPLFAIPRLATVSFAVGVSQAVPTQWHTLVLFLFSLVFFSIVLFFSLKPRELVAIIGKYINPAFLVLLTILFITFIFKPLGSVQLFSLNEPFSAPAFMNGFVEGYNTMDALAGLAFGILVVQAVKNLGLTEAKDISGAVLKAGVISSLLMIVIYSGMAYIGASQLNVLPYADNGGSIFYNLTQYYFGPLGNIVLFLTITLACLKTGIGLITACSEISQELFPGRWSYKQAVVVLTIVSAAIANVGLNRIIAFSLPVLSFLYPFIIIIAVLANLSPLFDNAKLVYRITLFFALPFVLFYLSFSFLYNVPFIQKTFIFLDTYLPLFTYGMGWVIPAVIGFLIALIVLRLQHRTK